MYDPGFCIVKSFSPLALGAGGTSNWDSGVGGRVDMQDSLFRTVCHHTVPSQNS